MDSITICLPLRGLLWSSLLLNGLAPSSPLSALVRAARNSPPWLCLAARLRPAPAGIFSRRPGLSSTILSSKWSFSSKWCGEFFPAGAGRASCAPQKSTPGPKATATEPDFFPEFYYIKTQDAGVGAFPERGRGAEGCQVITITVQPERLLIRIHNFIFTFKPWTLKIYNH